jgi:hypothetical protein
MSYAGLKPCRSYSQSESWGWLQNMANMASAFESQHRASVKRPFERGLQYRVRYGQAQC